jgi:hypothetical protein
MANLPKNLIEKLEGLRRNREELANCGENVPQRL